MFQSVLRRLRDRQTDGLEGVGAAEAGFTLIELMVVLLIIAILLAIAIPTFLGVTSSANDRAAQSNLTNGLTEAASQYQAAAQSYSGVSALLVASAPEFTWTAPGTACTTAQPNCISVGTFDVATVGDAQAVILAAVSKTGTCWWVAQLQTTPVVLASPGFIQLAYNATHAAGMEMIGGTSAATATGTVATAGTYYAKKANVPANTCDANYPPAAVGGFGWGSSFSAASAD